MNTPTLRILSCPSLLPEGRASSLSVQEQKTPSARVGMILYLMDCLTALAKEGEMSRDALLPLYEGLAWLKEEIEMLERAAHGTPQQERSER